MEGQKIAYSYVRFSTPEQAKGASLERQVEKAQKWAKENGYSLDENFRLDRGVSAFRSANAKTGQLAAFLEEAKQGRIPKGSVLIVESLDRLSRADIFTAQKLFSEIIENGVDIVSLIDNKHYSQEMGVSDAIVSVVSFALSNEESKKKSERVGDAWARKRSKAAATGKRMTQVIPAWLRPTDEDGIEIIPERAELVKWMFESTISGMGNDSITRWLVRKGITPWGRVTKRTNREKPVWHKSYVRKILTNESVTGRYAPTRLVEGKRVPTETIEEYFPRIISDGMFAEAQRAMKSRSNSRGRTGQFSNLFRGVIFCGYCRSTFSYMNKGNPPKGRQYLACSHSRLGQGCDSIPVKYQAVEDAVLGYCKEIKVKDVMSNGNLSKEIAELNVRLSEERAKRDRLKNRQDQMISMIGQLGPSAIKAVTEQLDKVSIELEDVIQGVTDLEDAHAAMTESSKTLKEHLDTMADLQRRLEAADEDERLELRRRLQQTITKAIRRLTIYPDGLRANIVSLAIDNDGSRITIKPFLDEDDAFQEERIKHLTDHIQANTGRENACFLVEFANGHTRLFRRDPSEKKARFLVDSEMTSDSLVIGGRDFVANHGPKITISKEPFGGKPPADQEQPEQTGDSKPPAVSWTPRRRQKISGYISHLVDTALPIPEEGEGKPADE